MIALLLAATLATAPTPTFHRPVESKPHQEYRRGHRWAIPLALVVGGVVGWQISEDRRGRHRVVERIVYVDRPRCDDDD
jgi:hypothetical protein